MLAKSLCCMKSEPPRIAQFTAIRGRNIPREEYRLGTNFSTTISTIWTNAAMTAMNTMKLRKLRSTPKGLFVRNLLIK